MTTNADTAVHAPILVADRAHAAGECRGGMRRRLTRWSISGLLTAFIGVGVVGCRPPRDAVKLRAPVPQAPAPRPATRPRAAWPRAVVTADSVLAITNVTVLDVQTGTLHAGQTVVVIGRWIQAVGAARRVPVPAGARRVDGTGGYLIPGLWDMHSHIGALVPSAELPAVMRIAHVLLLANGITGIRDAGTAVPLDSLLAWRRAIWAGYRVGPPRQLLAGPALQTKAPADATHQLAVPTLADVRRVVDSLLAAGADHIKLHDFPSPLQDSIVADLRQRHILFGGHVSTVDTGARFADHDFYGGSEQVPGFQGRCKRAGASVERCRLVAERMRRHDMWYVLSPLGLGGGLGFARAWSRLSPAQQALLALPAPPVQSPAEWKAARDSLSNDPSRSLRVFERAGVPLLAGTDGPMSHILYLYTGFALHDGLAGLVQAGLTPLAALQAVTLNPAKALHATDSLGTVAPGKLADLVLLDADPLADIRNTLAIHGVVANGRYFDRSALDSLLASVDYGMLVHQHPDP